MDDDEFRALSHQELITIGLDYRKRFVNIVRIINSYGTISNDDFIGLIDKLVPGEFK